MTALATTSMTTSPGPGTGSGTSVHSRTSGPPGALTVIACMASKLFGRVARADPAGCRHDAGALAAAPPGAAAPRGWCCAPTTTRVSLELVAEAHRGVHPPEEMPFVVPWTDDDRPPGDAAALLVASGRSSPRRGGRSTSSSASTAAWSACRGWRRTNFADHCARWSPGPGSACATSAAGSAPRCAPRCWRSPSTTSVPCAPGRRRSAENTASMRVSERLGYRADGTETVARRGAPAEMTSGSSSRAPTVSSVRTAGGRRGPGRPAPAAAPAPPARQDQPRLTPRANVSHRVGSPVW